jgi:hypothetical protein
LIIGAPGLFNVVETTVDVQPVALFVKVTLYVPAPREEIVYGSVTPAAEPAAVPVHVTVPVPAPLTKTLPFVPLQTEGLVGVRLITGRGLIVTVPEAEVLEHPVVGFVMITE